jgi:nicotinamidase-related amidase
VIVTGFCAEACVLSTARGAEDYDFNAIILRGALASTNPERIPFVESISDLISYGALKTVLAA